MNWRFVLVGFIDILSVASIGYGTWLVYEPAAFIVVGLIFWWEVNINADQKPSGTTEHSSGDR